MTSLRGCQTLWDRYSEIDPLHLCANRLKSQPTSISTTYSHYEERLLRMLCTEGVKHSESTAGGHSLEQLGEKSEKSALSSSLHSQGPLSPQHGPTSPAG